MSYECVDCLENKTLWGENNQRCQKMENGWWSTIFHEKKDNQTNLYSCTLHFFMKIHVYTVGYFTLIRYLSSMHYCRVAFTEFKREMGFWYLNFRKIGLASNYNKKTIFYPIYLRVTLLLFTFVWLRTWFFFPTISSITSMKFTHSEVSWDQQSAWRILMQWMM